MGGPPSSSAGPALDADAEEQPLPAAAADQAQQGHSSSGRGYVSSVLERAKSLGMGSHDAAAAAAAAAEVGAPADGPVDQAVVRTAGIASSSKGVGTPAVEHLGEGDRLLLRMPRRWQVGVRTVRLFMFHALRTQETTF